MKKVLITGAAGALGRAAVARICAEGMFECISIARGPIDGTSGQFISCDLHNSEHFAAAIESTRPDLILHLAGRLYGSFEELYRINVEPARQMLDLVERGKLKTRVVLIGSAAEYGVVKPAENPISESHALFPVSSYGVSKAWQTQLLGLYSGRGLDVVCARLFNLFGSGISNRLFAGRVQREIEAVLAHHKDVIELGSLGAVRDYVSIEEAVRQLLLIANFGIAGEIYHVGSGLPVSMAEFLRRQLELYGLDQSIVRQSPDFSNRVGFDVPVIYADMKKTNALGSIRVANPELA